MYYRGAKAAIIVYDITSRESFSTLKNWVKELGEHGPEDMLLAVVGNKSDLDLNRDVATEDAEKYASNIDASFCEVSAKESSLDKVEQIFCDFIRKLPSDDEGIDIEERFNLNQLQSNTDRGTCC